MSIISKLAISVDFTIAKSKRKSLSRREKGFHSLRLAIDLLTKHQDELDDMIKLTN
jgi:hypothetical protein